MAHGVWDGRRLAGRIVPASLLPSFIEIILYISVVLDTCLQGRAQGRPFLPDTDIIYALIKA